jgi:hypothetical protein
MKRTIATVLVSATMIGCGKIATLSQPIETKIEEVPQVSTGWSTKQLLLTTAGAAVAVGIAGYVYGKLRYSKGFDVGTRLQLNYDRAIYTSAVPEIAQEARIEGYKQGIEDGKKIQKGEVLQQRYAGIDPNQPVHFVQHNGGNLQPINNQLVQQPQVQYNGGNWFSNTYTWFRGRGDRR